jgi:hypothetical protein
MDGERPNSSPTGRDVAGAWFFCLLIAMFALGLTSNLHGGLPPAATEVTDWLPCSSAPGSACRPSAEAEGNRIGTVAGLHRLTRPTQPSGGQYRRG